jgi:hypothetical protein
MRDPANIATNNMGFNSTKITGIKPGIVSIELHNVYQLRMVIEVPINWHVLPRIILCTLQQVKLEIGGFVFNVYRSDISASFQNPKTKPGRA